MTRLILGRYILPDREAFIRMVRERMASRNIDPDAWPISELDPLIGTYDRMMEAINALENKLK